jgi:hypothetical protein
MESDRNNFLTIDRTKRSQSFISEVPQINQTPPRGTYRSGSASKRTYINSPKKIKDNIM